jgi:superoxide reductase
MEIFNCQICGHLVFNNLPEKCPVCGAYKDKFVHNNNVFKESTEKSPELEAKHIPEVTTGSFCELIPESKCFNIMVRVGKVIHPMEEKHYIRFIDVYQNDKFIARTEFTPLKLFPAMSLYLKETATKMTIVQNCNIHGYWKSDVG